MRDSHVLDAKGPLLQELKARITDKDKRCFDAVQFADGLEDITDIKFSESCGAA